MASRSKQDLDEILSTAYDKACVEYQLKYPNAPQPFLTCTYRSNEEQTVLYNQPNDGKDNNGNGIIDDKSEKVTQAKAGESPHNYNPSKAFDIGFINPITQKLDWSFVNFKNFADIIIKIQPLVEWGGDWKFKDVPHFQRRNWRKYIK
jgi:peptidoglycan L-alanyl-D-glutamate endopeptidase CwlK